MAEITEWLEDHPQVKALLKDWSPPSEPEAELRNTYILRHLARLVHAEKSKNLATSNRTMASELSGLENQLADFSQNSFKTRRFEDLFIGKPKPRELPDPKDLWTKVPRTKFDRADRTWERRLLFEALFLKWHVSVLDAWVKVQDAEIAYRKIQDSGWPDLIVLFVEGSGMQNPIRIAQNTSYWHGSWWITHRPWDKSRKTDILKAADLEKPYSEAKWTLLFPSKAG